MNTPYLHTTQTKLMLQVKSDLDRHEGYREYAYPDPLSRLGRRYRGKDWRWGFVPAKPLLSLIGDMKEKDGTPWTVGYGFTQGVNASTVMPKLLAESKLEVLILELDDELSDVLSWYRAAPFVVKTILINMAFNMGIKGLLGFKNTLSYIRQGNYEQAATNMRKSLWYKQVSARAEELSKRMETQKIPDNYKAPERLC